jgi:DNA polymerase I-like protein with 3'-5' exonuclease and polymerase domains
MNYLITNTKTLFDENNGWKILNVISQTETTISRLVNVLQSSNIYYLDTETTGLDPHLNRLLLVTIRSGYDTIVIDFSNLGDKQEAIKVLLNSYLTKEEKTIVWFNGKFDYKFMLKNFGIHLTNHYDLFLAHKAITNGLDEPNSLKDVVNKYLGFYMAKEERTEFLKYDKSTYLPKLSHIQYAAKDVDVLEDLYEILRKEVRDKELTQVVDLENSVMPAYAFMEYTGVPLDITYWQENIISKYQALADICLDNLTKIALSDPALSKYKIKNPIVNLFGEPDYAISRNGKPLISKEAIYHSINWNSNQQVLEIMKNDYGIECSYKIQGQVKQGVNADVLLAHCSEEFKHSVSDGDLKKGTETASSIFEWLYLLKKTEKLLRTYGQNLIDIINPVTKRLHCEFNQMGTDTGRVSSNNPNLQNLPRLQEFRSGIRVHGDDKWLITLDYDGAELRIIADGAEEPTMIRAFNDGEDVHAFLATKAYGVTVTKKENKHLRNNMKTVNFGLAYGAGPSKFADIFGSVEKAKDFLDNVYYKNFPKLKTFFNSLAEFGQTNGYITTFPPISRKRFFPNHEEIVEKAKTDKEYQAKLAAIGRESKNTPIQGTSADIIKLATATLFNEILRNNMLNNVKIINQVHDELTIELNGYSLEEARSFATWIKGVMVYAGSLQIKHVVMEVSYDIDKIWVK